MEAGTSSPLILKRRGFNREENAVLFWKDPKEVQFVCAKSQAPWRLAANSTLIIHVIDCEAILQEDYDCDVYIRFGDVRKKSEPGFSLREQLYDPSVGRLNYNGNLNNLGLIVRQQWTGQLVNIEVKAEVSFVMIQ
jgi:hypothetical protein